MKEQNQSLKPELKNTICAQPWVGLQVNPSREIRPCCMYDESLGIYTGAESLQRYFSNPLLLSVREQMQEGKWPKGCLSCRREEELTGTSPRIFSPGFSEPLHRHEVRPNFQKVEIFFDNVCNLDCVMCRPRFSTKWNRHVEPLNRLGINFDSFSKTESTRLTKDDILSLLDQCETAQNVILIGGEPFASPEATFFLEQWVARDYSGQLEIITNGTLIDDLRFEQLAKIKNLVLKLSVDGVGKVYEWVRGFGWAHFQQLAPKFKNLQARVLLCPTIGFYNLFDMKNLASFAEDNKVSLQLSHVLRHPAYLSVGILPLEVRSEVARQFKVGRTGAFNTSAFDHLMASPVHTNAHILKTQAKKWCDYFDHTRGILFSEIAPEAHEILMSPA